MWEAGLPLAFLTLLPAASGRGSHWPRLRLASGRGGQQGRKKSQVAFISGSITGMRWARKSKGIKLARKITSSSPFLRMEWTTKDDGVEITKQRVENTHLKTEKCKTHIQQTFLLLFPKRS